MSDKSAQEDATPECSYSNPVIPRPPLEKVRKMAGDLGLNLPEEELESMTSFMGGLLKDYDCVYRLVEPKPPVKYPRTPGYRPSAEENKLNAWYMKTDIHGAMAGKLLNKKVAVKDNVALAGVPMMNGSKLLEGYVPEYDATVVTRILDAGGHIVGKSACEHFCLSGNSFTNDIAPVLNPHDTTRSSGGSSSGSGALVASGEVDLAIGGDQGGSIRIPSSWSGIVGLKPTFGLVPYTGAIPIEQTIDHLGPMARTVTDCALFLEVLAGNDGMDYRQKLDIVVPEYSKQLKSDLSGMKVGIVKEGFEGCEDDVVSVVKAAAESLKDAGASVAEVSIPMHRHGVAIWTPIGMEGSFVTMVERAGAGPSFKGFLSTTLMDHQHRALKLMPNSLSKPMKLALLFGEYLKEHNNFHFYSRSSNLMMALTAAYDAALEDFDVLVMPTIPCKAQKLPTNNFGTAELIAEAFKPIKNTASFCGTGHPALTINAGTSEGLPVGMMIIGKKWHEQDVLNVAYGFECLRDKN